MRLAVLSPLPTVLNVVTPMELVWHLVQRVVMDTSLTLGQLPACVSEIYWTTEDK